MKGHIIKAFVSMDLCPSGKKIYVGKAYAKKMAKEHSVKFKHKMTTYRCLDCGRFHLTSYTSKERESIRERRKNGKLG